MLTKKIRRLIKSLALLILLLVALLLFANYLIQKQNVQAYLVKHLSEFSNFDISTGDIELNLLHGVGISVENFTAQQDNRPENIIIPKLRIIVDPKELLKGRIAPRTIYLVEPRIKLHYEQLIAPLIDPDTDPKKGLHPIWYTGIQAVYIEGGRISILDKTVGIENLHLSIQQNISFNSALSIYGRGLAINRGEEIPFNIKGDFLAGTEKRSNPYLDFTVETGKISVNALPPLSSFPETNGHFHTNLWLKGYLSEGTSLGGKIFIDKLDFVFRMDDQQKQFVADETTIDFTSLIEKDRISISRMKISSSALSLSLGFTLDMEDKDNPNLDLEIKSGFMESSTVKAIWPSPLLYPWFDEKLLPALESGKVRLNKFTARGYMEQFHNPELPENRSVFDLELDCKDLTFAGTGIPLPFENVSGAVIWKERDFFIKDMTAEFGESIIRNASLSMNRNINGSRSTEVLLEGSFDLKELMLQKDMNLIPENVRDSFELTDDLNGKLECRTKFNYESGWEYPLISNSKLIFSECLLERQELQLPLRIREAEFNIYENNQNQFTGTGYWGNSEFRTTGSFEISGRHFDVQKMDIFSHIDMDQVLPLIYSKKSFPLHFNKPLAGQISIEKEDEYMSCRGNIDLEGSSIESDRLTMTPPGKQDSILFDVNLDQDKIIAVNRFICVLNGSSIELTGSYDLKTEDILEFEISSSGLSLEALGVQYKQTDLPARGLLKGRLKTSIPTDNTGETILTGQISGESLFLDLDLSPEPIKECNFMTTLSGKNMIINHLNMKIGDSPVNITGSLSGWETLKGDLTVTSDYINFFDLFPQNTESSQKKAKENSFWKMLDLEVDLDVSRGKWKELEWGPLDADLNVINGDINILRSQVELKHGALQITGYKKNGIDSGILLKSHVSLKNQPVNKLLEDIGFSNMGISGSLDMEADLLMQGIETKDLIPSLSGTANIMINEGLVKKPRMFLKVLELMSLQKILQNFYKQRPPHLREKGLYFQNMQGDAVIDHGIARTENFVMKSPALNAVAIGEEDLVRQTHNLELFTQPLGTLETILRNIPIVGRILLGDEKKSILTVGYKVTGSWSEPDVKPVPLESFGKGVLGTLERILLTPVEIIKDIRDVTDKIIKDDSSSTEDQTNKEDNSNN